MKRQYIIAFAILIFIEIVASLLLFFYPQQTAPLVPASYISPTATPAKISATPTPKPVPGPSPTTPAKVTTSYPTLKGPQGVAGLNVWLFEQDQAQIGQVTQWLDDLSVKWVRHQLPWEKVEPKKGQYQWDDLDKTVQAMKEAGRQVMLNPVHSPGWACNCTVGMPKDPADFGRFMAVVAQRYKGQVAAYEIWNEANLAQEAGKPINAGRYVELLKAAYTAIKEVDPQAIVVFGGLTPTGVNDLNIAIDDLEYLKQIYAYQGGVVKGYFDIMGAHPGSTLNPPDLLWPISPGSGPGWLDHPSFYFRRIEQLRQVMVDAGDAQKQVWLTEFGWASVGKGEAAAGFGFAELNSEEQQARYIARALEMGRNNYSWIGLMFLFQLNFALPSVTPDDKDERIAWGIIRRDGSKRPAYTAVRDFATAKIQPFDFGANLQP